MWALLSTIRKTFFRSKNIENPAQKAEGIVCTRVTSNKLLLAVLVNLRRTFIHKITKTLSNSFFNLFLLFDVSFCSHSCFGRDQKSSTHTIQHFPSPSGSSLLQCYATPAQGSSRSVRWESWGLQDGRGTWQRARYPIR